MPTMERKTIENLRAEELIFRIDPPVKKPGTVKEKLRASEVRYRRVFEAAKDGILILDAVT